jgi:hypothetical protein
LLGAFDGGAQGDLSAKRATDGLTNGCSSVGISKTQPVEILEQALPDPVRPLRLARRLGGAGRHRGGFGVDYQIRLLRGEAKASFLMDHGRVGPPGLLGGSPGAVNEIAVSQGGVIASPPHLSKGEGYVLAPGDSIADDVYGDIYFGAERPKPFSALDPSGDTIYCSSFSKTIAPGYRIGWLATRRHMQRVLEHKLASTLSSPALPQAALADFLSCGGYDSHLRRTGSSGRRR